MDLNCDSNKILGHQSNNDRRWLLIITAVALVFRLGHFIMLHTDPACNVPVLDSLSYDRLARLIAFGDGMPAKVYFQAPFYPYFLALIYKYSAGSIDLVRLIQILLDIASTLFVYRFTRNLFDHTTAKLAGLGIAVYPVLIFNTGLILKTTLNVFFASLTLWLIFQNTERYKLLRVLAIGAVTGWAAATQGSVLLQIPLLFVWVLFDTGIRSWRSCLKYSMVLTAGLIVSIGPFTLRNYMVSQRFVLLTAQGGANFYLGNSPYSDGTSKRPPNVRVTPEHEEEDFHREAERLAGRKLTPEAASAFWTRAALDWIKSEPVAALKLQLRKIGLFWNHVEIPDNYDFDFFRRYSLFIRFPRYPFWVAGTLGLCGMLFLWRTWRRTWFLYCWILSYTSIWVIFHIYSRYRLPVVVFIMPFAAAFVTWSYDNWKQKRWKPLVNSLIILIIIGLFQSLPLTDYSHAQSFFNLGTCLSRQGKIEEASQAFKDALSVHESYAPAMVNLGKIAWAQMNAVEAESWWTRALEADPNSAEAHSNMGTVCAVSGRMEEARKHFSDTVLIQPYYLLGWLHLAQSEQALGNYMAAVSAFDVALELDSTNSQALYGKAVSTEKINPSQSIGVWKQYIDVARNDPRETEFVREALIRLKTLEQPDS